MHEHSTGNSADNQPNHGTRQSDGPSRRNVVKIGVIGLGNIGRHHLSYIKDIPRVELAGVCDAIVERADQFADAQNTKAYYNPETLFSEAKPDAVIIAVPHYDHVPIAIEAFRRGIHVLCEKPLAVHVNDAQKVIDAYNAACAEHPHLVFGMMFNERTLPFYRKIKEIITNGELGQLVRATWIHTKWFRTQAYYDSGTWRATWAGEGGGILTNQCPHNLDMYQWLFGLPEKISGHAHIGKYHNIEVEDEVTAYFEHKNGMVGHFIVTTAEAPGTNRLEIVGENGKLVYEDGKLLLDRNAESMLQYSQNTETVWGSIASETEEVQVNNDRQSGHHVVTEKFVGAILDGTPLIADGREGISSVTLANGIMLSSFTNRMIQVPFNGNLYERELNERIQTSKFVKTNVPGPTSVHIGTDSDISRSFSK